MRKTPTLHHILYVSLSKVAASGPEIGEIARVALARNSQAGVTGFLYYDDAVFLQVLEGIEPDVSAIYASIQRDERHREVTTLIDAPVRSRQFGGWAMGFYDGSLEHHPAGVVGSGFHARAQQADPADLVRFLRELALGNPNVRLVTDEP